MININTKEIWDNKLAEDQKLEYKQYFLLMVNLVISLIKQRISYYKL